MPQQGGTLIKLRHAATAPVRNKIVIKENNDTCRLHGFADVALLIFSRKHGGFILQKTHSLSQ